MVKAAEQSIWVEMDVKLSFYAARQNREHLNSSQALWTGVASCSASLQSVALGRRQLDPVPRSCQSHTWGPAHLSSRFRQRRWWLTEVMSCSQAARGLPSRDPTSMCRIQNHKNPNKLYPAPPPPSWLHADKASNQCDGFQPWRSFPQAAQLGKYFSGLFLVSLTKQSSICVSLSEQVVDVLFHRQDGP